MPIRIVCACGKTLNAPDEAAGHRVKCPGCGAILDVPSPELEAARALAGTRPSVEPGTGEKASGSFLAEIGMAFAYPLTGKGMAILAGVAAVYFVSLYVPIAGLVARLLLDLFLTAYFFTIIQSSSGGEKRQPSLPDATDLWDDLVRPIFWMLAAGIFSALPLIVYLVVAGRDKGQPNLLIVELLGAWASFYFPMAILAMSLMGTVLAISPHIVLPAIVRISGPYLLLAVFVWLVWSGYAFTVRTFGDSLIGSFVAFVTLVYLSWVIARAIGITHWIYRNRIGWFRST